MQSSTSVHARQARKKKNVPFVGFPATSRFSRSAPIPSLTTSSSSPRFSAKQASDQQQPTVKERCAAVQRGGCINVDLTQILAPTKNQYESLIPCLSWSGQKPGNGAATISQNVEVCLCGTPKCQSLTVRYSSLRYSSSAQVRRGLVMLVPLVVTRPIRSSIVRNSGIFDSAKK